jgi:ribosome-associated toxin RatA of RatAB toxin-antitoxin module
MHGMADQATEHMTIAAPLERVLAVAEDVERYPEWARDVKSVEIIERGEDGRPLRVAFRAGAMGHSAHYVLRYSYGESPTSIAWVLEQGDVVRRLDGQYIFEPVDGDTGTTAVTYHLEAELAVPLPGFVKRRAEGKIMTTALDELKRRVEQP